MDTSDKIARILETIIASNPFKPFPADAKLLETSVDPLSNPQIK